MTNIGEKELEIIFAKVKENAIIPSKEDENAGFDIYACWDGVEKKDKIIKPHTTKLIPTGIASAMTDKYYLNVAERGSTGKIGMKYSAGIIDSGYRGEIFIALTNTNINEIIINVYKKSDVSKQMVLYKSRILVQFLFCRSERKHKWRE